MSTQTQTQTQQERQTRWQTPIMRASFPKLVEPDKFGKYSVTGIIHLNAAQGAKFGLQSIHPTGLTDSDLQRLNAMIAAANACRESKWPDKKSWVGVKNPFRKGIEDDGSNNGYDLAKYKEYTGNLILQVGSKGRRIPVVDKNRVEIPADRLKEEFYPGCWFIAFVTFFTSEVENTKRVSIGCQSIMKIKDDSPFIAVADPQKDYEHVDLNEYGVDNSASFGDAANNAGI